MSEDLTTAPMRDENEIRELGGDPKDAPIQTVDIADLDETDSKAEVMAAIDVLDDEAVWGIESYANFSTHQLRWGTVQDRFGPGRYALIRIPLEADDE